MYYMAVPPFLYADICNALRNHAGARAVASHSSHRPHTTPSPPRLAARSLHAGLAREGAAVIERRRQRRADTVSLNSHSVAPGVIDLSLEQARRHGSARRCRAGVATTAAAAQPTLRPVLQVAQELAAAARAVLEVQVLV